MGDKISAEDKGKIEAAVAELKTAMEGTDSEKIKSETEKLTEVSYDVFGKVYQQAAAEAQTQQQANGAQNTNSGATDDNVVDADYEVVDDK